jgi:phenylalanyl-tRNA synthetase beta chain
MQVSYNWLRELVDFGWDAQTLASKLTLIGTAVESVQPVSTNLENVVVGKILTVEPHPHSPNLKVCKVELGRDVQMNVVCGAPNVKVGMKSPLALSGAVLKDGLRIQSVDKHGVVSEGMLCSQAELGISEDHSGIMELELTAKAGSDLKTTLSLDDVSLSFDLTPNRADSLSAIGIARDIAALCGSPVKRPTAELKEIADKAAAVVDISIEDPIGCPRYAARMIKGVKIGRSPWWMQQRLLASGIRAINVIVDITNYVMLEYGHPLHAFDFANFAQAKVLVRRASAGEIFRTLDGVDRKLNDDVLLITDGVKPVAIAGIMGGEFSEVTEKTTDILLESAYFDPSVTRRARKYLGLQSESQTRFERGADPSIVPAALDRAASLMERLAGGRVLAGIVDVYPQKIHPVKLELRPSRVNQILATDMSAPMMIDILHALEFKVLPGKNLTVEVPTFRPDVTREIDVIEEIARIYGYERIPTRLFSGGELLLSRNPREVFVGKIREELIGQGYFEVVTNSIVNPKQIHRLNPQQKCVEILNPISEDLKWLRPSLLSGLLNAVYENTSHQIRTIKLFEIGTVMTPKEGQLPNETQRVALALSGSDMGENWAFHPTEFTFHDLKGAIEGIEGLTDRRITYSPMSNAAFDPACCFQVTLGVETIGICGAIQPAILKTFNIKAEVLVAELDLEVLLASAKPTKPYKQLQRFPISERDIAIVVDEGVFCAELLETIRGAADQTLVETVVLDLYKGKQVDSGKKSLAFRLVFQDESKTLTDADIERVINRMVESLKLKHGAILRA